MQGWQRLPNIPVDNQRRQAIQFSTDPGVAPLFQMTFSHEFFPLGNQCNSPPWGGGGTLEFKEKSTASVKKMAQKKHGTAQKKYFPAWRTFSLKVSAAEKREVVGGRTPPPSARHRPPTGFMGLPFQPCRWGGTYQDDKTLGGGTQPSMVGTSNP